MGKGGGGQNLTFFNDRWEFPGQLGGAPGSIKDYFKHGFVRFSNFRFDTFGSIRDQSGSNFGPSQTTLGPFAWSKTPPTEKLIL